MQCSVKLGTTYQSNKPSLCATLSSPVIYPMVVKFGAKTKKVHSLKKSQIFHQIPLYNCLLIHDYSRNLLPSSFDTFFTLCTELHNNDTRRQAGCVFVPHYNSNRYGRQSIKLSCILNWNHLSEVLNQNLLSLTKPNLKKSITQYFLSTYSN